jgi:transcriptional regulator with XRE-family HTH domain
MTPNMTSLQYKLARIALGLTVLDAAALCAVSHETIRRIEGGDPSVKYQTILKVRAALENAGIEFIGENGSGLGVRLMKGSTIGDMAAAIPIEELTSENDG